MINGVINIFKEKGYTSADVVAKLRGILHQKKIGHTGTLDPAAEGVLPVCLGNATRLVEYLTDKDKEYVCTIRLGVTTDTEDMTGTVLQEKAVETDEAEFAEAARSFIGDYQQVPPMYSALKQNGRRLYELAREGAVVERPPRAVRIPELEILKMELPLAEFRVVCSKGTYIRSLCRDIGEKLGCGAAMEKLKRTRSGSFNLETALTLDQVQELRDAGTLEAQIFSVEQFFSDRGAVSVPPEDRRLLENGNALSLSVLKERMDVRDGEQLRVYDDEGHFRAIYRYDAARKMLCAETMFL